MDFMLAIALPFVISAPVVLIAISMFPKMFPEAGHWFILAMCLVPFAMSAHGAQGVLSGWGAALTGFVSWALLVLVCILALAGLWDCYAKARNGGNNNFE